MPGFRNLFFSTFAVLALLGLVGCGAETESVEHRSGPASPEVHDAIARLTAGDADAAPGALDDLVKAGDYRMAAFLKSFREGQSIYRWKDRLVLVDGFEDGVAVLQDHILRTKLTADGKPVTAPKADLEEVSAPRRLRRSVLGAEDQLKMSYPLESVCLAAAKKCGNSRRAEFLSALEKLAEDPARSKKVHRVARTGVCQILISGNVPGLDDGALLAAVKELGELQSESSLSSLKDLEKKEDTSPTLAAACRVSIEEIELAVEKLEKG